MKLSFECYEELASLSARGPIGEQELKMLQLGILSIAKDVKTPLIINISLAKVDSALTHTLFTFKKALPALTQQKIYWISTISGVADFAKIDLFAQKIKGFKQRQIFDRLKLEDEVYLQNEQVAQLEAKLKTLSPDENQGQMLILKNKSLTEEIRVLKESIRYRSERTKLQEPVVSENEKIQEETEQAAYDIKKAYGIDVNK